MRRPLVIIVSGAPGAGKTTLAQQLALYLQIPHIARDTILRGIEMSRGGKIDRGGVGVATYYSILRFMIEQSVSFVTDGTIYAGISEEDIKENLVANAEVINIHVRAENEYERFVAREKERDGWSSEWVEEHREHLEKIYHQAVDPLGLGVPLIEVNASDGYDPTIKELAVRIRDLYKDTRPGITAV